MSPKKITSMKRIFQILMIIIVLLFSVTTLSFSQNDRPEFINLLKKDFIFRVVGYRETPDSELKQFNYTVPGNYNYNLVNNCEFKIFFKEEIIQFSFRYDELIFKEGSNDEYTFLIYGARGMDNKTGKKCNVGIYSILGDPGIYLAVGSDETTPITYVIKLGF
jgi:hypothetical protein